MTELMALLMGLSLYWAIDSIRRNRWKRRCRKAEENLWIASPLYMRKFYESYEKWQEDFE